ncbi:MAG: thioredoxin domain-containing protein [Polyangiaceae bacterium]
MKSSLRLPLAMLAALVAACGGSAPPTPTAPDLKVAKGGADVAPAVAQAASEDDAAIPIRATDPTWGSRTAPVTIVQFEDFQCPFCSRAERTMSALKKEYGPDKLRVVWKDSPLPFHPNARPAAEWGAGVMALAGSQAFWKFHDAAFDNQADLGDAKYAEWSKLLGLDPQSIARGVKAHTWSAGIDDDLALAKKLDANGTPSFFVNGVSLVGAQPIEKFEEIIDDQLHKAYAKLEAGTPGDRVYAVMTVENLKNPPVAADDDGPDEDTAVYKVPVGTSPVKGPATALVTIVEFADFQCPYCAKVNPALEKIATTYGSDVRFVWKNEPLPFHKSAEPAAQLALEARAEKGDSGFWAAHDRLFAAQPNLEEKDLERIAGELKLDVTKVKSAIKTHKYKAVIAQDQSLADDVQATGTPHFFVNGKRLVGAQPFDKFKTLVDAELASAKALVAKGVPATNVYDVTIKDGKGAATPEKKTVAAAAKSPTRGKATAKVTVVEFADFQCPFCSRVENDAITQLRKDYPDTVKVVWRDLPLPFHEHAMEAAEAAREAFAQKGETGFWKMHDLLFANQTSLDRPSLDGYAKRVGLDMTKYANAMETHSHKADIDADVKAAKDADINGTPAFVINGYFLSGAQPYTKFKKLVDLSLAPPASPGVGAPKP